MSVLSAREFLRRVRANPFLRLSEQAIRERAYFRWQQEPQLGELEHWLAAEDAETDLCAVTQLVRAVDKTQTSGVERQFDVEYDPVASWAFPPGSPAHPVILGSSSPRRCSICREGRPKVTFKKEAHVVPESLGNKWLTTWDECDDCNQRFGNDYEGDLGKLTLAVRALSGTRAKSKTAKLKTGPSSSLGGGDRLGPVEIVVHPLDPTVRINLGRDGTLSLEASLQSFRPAHAAKALARVAWQSLPPSRRAAHEPLRAWLHSDRVGPGVIYSAHVPGLAGLTVGLWERVSDVAALASLVVAVGFNHTVLLWAAPEWDSQSHQSIIFPLLPRPLGGASIGITRYQATGDKRVTKGRAYFELAYKRAVLRWTRDPLPVVVDVQGPDGLVKIAASLRTPDLPDDLRGKLVAHDISGGELVGNLHIAIPFGPGEPQSRYSFESKVAGDPKKTAVLVDAINRGASYRVVTADGARPVVDVGGKQVKGPLSPEEVAPRVLAASLLATINLALGLDIPFPDAIDQMESRVLELVAEGIGKGRVAERPGVMHVVTDADGARQLAQLLGSGPRTLEAMNEIPMVFKDVPIDPGPIRIILEHAELVEDADTLLARSRTWTANQRERVEVRCSRVIHEFVRFLREEPPRDDNHNMGESP